MERETDSPATTVLDESVTDPSRDPEKLSTGDPAAGAVHDPEKGDGVHGVERIDGGALAWMAVWSTFFGNFCGLGLSYGFGVYQETYALELYTDWSVSVINLIGTLTLAITLGGGIIAGRFCELFGHRLVATVGAVIVVVGWLSASFCNTIPTLIVTQGVLVGTGNALLFVPICVIPVMWWDKRKNLAMGISTAGSGVGGIFWALVTRVMVQRVGTQWALRITSFVVAFVLSIVLYFMRPRKSYQAGSKEGSFMTTAKDCLNLKFILLFWSCIIAGFGYFVPWAYASQFSTSELGTTEIVSALAPSVINLGMTVGRIILGRVADSRFGLINTVFCGMLAGGVLQLALWIPATNSTPLFFVFCFFYGGTAGSYIGLLPIVIAAVSDPQKLAVILGIYLIAEVPGQLAGGPVAGAILEASGSYQALAAFAGACMIGGSVLMLWLRLLMQPKVLATV